MTDKAWKRTERRIAELLDGRRVPVSGRQRGDCPDIEHDVLAIEVKHRASFPAWLEDALRQAEASASHDGQLPVAVLHQNGRRYQDALAAAGSLEGAITETKERLAKERERASSAEVRRLREERQRVQEQALAAADALLAVLAEDNALCTAKRFPQRSTAQPRPALRPYLATTTGPACIEHSRSSCAATPARGYRGVL